MNIVSDAIASDELVGTAIDINKTAGGSVGRPIDAQLWRNDSPYFNTSLAEKNTPFQSGTSVTNPSPQIYVIPLGMSGTSESKPKAIETDSTIKVNSTQENFDVMSIFNNKNFLTIVIIALLIFAFKKS